MGLTAAGWTAILAVLTLALGLATAALGWYSRQTAKSGNEAAKAATRSANEEALAVERAHRPVLVPVLSVHERFEEITDKSGVESDLRPVLNVASDTVFVPIRNIGTGPAFNIHSFVEFGDATGEASAATSGEEKRHAGLVGASASSPYEILVFRDVKLSGMTGFRLTVSYFGIDGNLFTVRARYSLAENFYPEYNIEPMPGVT